MTNIVRTTHQIDATDQPMGRLATKVASILRGKNKVTFQMHLDEGDKVEVINIANMKLTGKKLEQKDYKWHTNYPGGLKTRKLSDVMRTNPGEALERAVWGMLPKIKARSEMMKRLTIKK